MNFTIPQLLTAFEAYLKTLDNNLQNERYATNAEYATYEVPGFINYLAEQLGRLDKEQIAASIKVYLNRPPSYVDGTPIDWEDENTIIRIGKFWYDVSDITLCAEGKKSEVFPVKVFT